MSLIKVAQKYAEMQKTGLSIAQISEKTGVDAVAIRERLQLLMLTLDEQEKVKSNELSYVQALKICGQRERNEARSKAMVQAVPVPHAYEPE
jgi:hypothetical protein